jgi:hypothetical protein
VWVRPRSAEPARTTLPSESAWQPVGIDDASQQRIQKRRPSQKQQQPSQKRQQMLNQLTRQQRLNRMKKQPPMLNQPVVIDDESPQPSQKRRLSQKWQLSLTRQLIPMQPQLNRTRQQPKRSQSVVIDDAMEPRKLRPIVRRQQKKKKQLLNFQSAPMQSQPIDDESRRQPIPTQQLIRTRQRQLSLKQPQQSRTKQQLILKRAVVVANCVDWLKQTTKQRQMLSCLQRPHSSMIELAERLMMPHAAMQLNQMQQLSRTKRLIRKRQLIQMKQQLSRMRPPVTRLSVRKAQRTQRIAERTHCCLLAPWRLS